MGVTNGLVDATLTGKPYPIKAWIVYGQNVLESIPQPQRTLKAIETLDLMVVVDVMPVDQIAYADLVLPEATYLERYDPPLIVELGQAALRLACASRSSSRSTSRSPAGGSRRSWRSGSGSRPSSPGRRPTSTWRRSSSRMEINPLELRTAGAVAFPGRPYLEDRTEDDLPLFDTASGKIELYSQDLADLGADPLPRYTPVDEPPDGLPPPHLRPRSDALLRAHARTTRRSTR